MRADLVSRGPKPKHSQQPPGVVQNWSALQCSKKNTEQCGYDHAPVTRGRMRAQFPLPHGPLLFPHSSQALYGLTQRSGSEAWRTNREVESWGQFGGIGGRVWEMRGSGGRWSEGGGMQNVGQVRQNEGALAGEMGATMTCPPRPHGLRSMAHGPSATDA